MALDALIEPNVVLVLAPVANERRVPQATAEVIDNQGVDANARVVLGILGVAQGGTALHSAEG